QHDGERDNDQEGAEFSRADEEPQADDAYAVSDSTRDAQRGDVEIEVDRGHGPETQHGAKDAKRDGEGRYGEPTGKRAFLALNYFNGDLRSGCANAHRRTSERNGSVLAD